MAYLRQQAEKNYEIEGGGETSPARRAGIIPTTTAANASCISEAE